MSMPITIVVATAMCMHGAHNDQHANYRSQQ